jgi:plastocyanin
MSNKLLVAALAAALPSLAFAQEAAPPTPTAASAAAPVTVEIDQMRFEPAALTIAVGTTVTWVNDDKSPHTVSDRGRVFRSAALDTKDSFSYTFATPGEFTYFCTLHPMMVGKIVVKPAGSSS